MIAIPGGTFSMGSPDDEPLRNADEGPVRKVKIDSFYMAEIEVSWDEYLAFMPRPREKDDPPIRKDYVPLVRKPMPSRGPLRLTDNPIRAGEKVTDRPFPSAIMQPKLTVNGFHR